MSTELSLYEYIKANIRDGELPENFRLPQDEERSFDFAPGTRDGMYVFHSVPEKISDADQASIKEFLEAASDGDYDKAEELVRLLGNKSTALPVMADVQQYIADHVDFLSAENLFQFACILMEQSSDVESVKFGLGISMLFICMDKDYKDTVRTLGLYDEFTLPAVINMLEWDRPVQEVFDIAKKVHGWGRIHAVDRLEPATQEISDWIFREGIDNTIDPGYSVFTCWMASQADQRIKEPMDREDYEAAARMLEALLKDTPAPGLSILGNAEEILTDFLDRIKEQPKTDLVLVKNIRDFAADENHKFEDIVSACEELMA